MKMPPKPLLLGGAWPAAAAAGAGAAAAAVDADADEDDWPGGPFLVCGRGGGGGRFVGFVVVDVAVCCQLFAE